MIRLAPILVLLVAFGIAAAGCSVRRGAPVIERSSVPETSSAAPRVSRAAKARAGDSRPDYYTVRRGDTLFSIALDHGLDYRELAEWNGITDPGVISVGQSLRLRPTASTATIAPLRTAPDVEGRPMTGAQEPAQPAQVTVKTEPKAVREPYTERAYAQLTRAEPGKPHASRPARVSSGPPQASQGESGVITWTWPASGKVVSTFNEAAKFKGISIAGKMGQPVTASAAGKVIFSGTGIRGLGKLIIIKHNDAFLSVYAHNSELLVKQDQAVAQGQKIAEMGKTDTDQVKLHFEIRRFGKPVDPLTLLPQG